MTDWTEEFLGVLFPAAPVPSEGGTKPDFKALEKFASWMKTQPVDGVALWTDTGRGSSLSREDRIAVLNIWRDALEDALPIIVEIGSDEGVPVESVVSSAIRNAQDAIPTARYFLVRPPDEFRDDPDRDSRILVYHHALAGFGIPLILSCGSDRSGNLFYSEEVLDTLMAMPEVAAVKTSMHDRPLLMQDLVTHILVKHLKKAVLSGEDRFYGYSLYRGCHGALVGLGSICPELQRELIDAWFMRETSRFLQLSRLIDHLAEAIYVDPLDGHVGRILAGLAHKGIIPAGSSLDPWGPKLTLIDLEFVKATLDAVGEWSDVQS